LRSVFPARLAHYLISGTQKFRDCRSKTLATDPGELELHELMEPPVTGVRSRDVSRPSTPIVGRLSLPGSSGSSLEPYRQRVGIAMVSRGFRTGVAFFIFGLMNNILYVIVLSVRLFLYTERRLMSGCIGFSGSNYSQRGGTACRCGAWISVQMHCAVLLPRCTISVLVHVGLV